MLKQLTKKFFSFCYLHKPVLRETLSVIWYNITQIRTPAALQRNNVGTFEGRNCIHIYNFRVPIHFFKENKMKYSMLLIIMMLHKQLQPAHVLSQLNQKKTREISHATTDRNFAPLGQKANLSTGWEDGSQNHREITPLLSYSKVSWSFSVFHKKNESGKNVIHYYIVLLNIIQAIIFMLQ